MATLLRACALGLGLLLTAVPVSWAADQTITLTLGFGSQLLLERPFKSVLSGNPNVVDVQNLTGSSVILKPLKIGTSNLIFLDEKSIAITNIRVLVCDASTI
jgi:Flp pilus assembly secretin CpaC